jgi:hypothetical protein
MIGTGLPLSTFLAFVVTAASVVIAVGWALNERRKEK